MAAHFTPELFRFLRDLKANNDRDWFKANKKRYENHVKDPSLAFITDFGPYLGRISPHFTAIPKAVGGSLFRIYRDVRFAKDKSPYKTHAGLHFRHAAGKNAHTPGFYLHLEPGEAMCGVGIWMPDNPTLALIRDAIVERPDDWTALKQQMAADGYGWMSEGALKRAPRGYDKDHPHVEDLKLKSFAVGRTFTEKQVVKAGFIEAFAGACEGAAPLARFVCKAIGVSF